MTDLFGPSSYTIDELIAEAERELRMREQVYPKQVAAHRMTQVMCDRRISLQKAIIEKLTGLRE